MRCSHENYALQLNGPRLPAVSSSDGYIANPDDKPDGTLLFLERNIRPRSDNSFPCEKIL
jgi:hypothetical protein